MLRLITLWVGTADLACYYFHLQALVLCALCAEIDGTADFICTECEGWHYVEGPLIGCMYLVFTTLVRWSGNA